MITVGSAERILEKRLIIWINPSRINLHLGNELYPITGRFRLRGLIMRGFAPAPKARSRLLNILDGLHPFVLSDRWFPGPTPIETLEKYRKVVDAIAHSNNIERSVWYAELTRDLRRKGVVYHKGNRLVNQAQVASFLGDYVRNLVATMKNEGYCLTKGSNIGTAMIGSRGELYKSGSANHRFFVAREVGMERFPLIVRCVHERWLEMHKIPNNHDGLTQIGRHLSDVERRYQ